MIYKGRGHENATGTTGKPKDLKRKGWLIKEGITKKPGQPWGNTLIYKGRGHKNAKGNTGKREDS